MGSGSEAGGETMVNYEVPDRTVSQLGAVREMIAALDLRPEHRGLVAYCEGLAEVIDQRPGQATLWAEYRPALEALLAAGEVQEDDGQTDLLRLVRTPVGDPKKSGAGKLGAGGGDSDGPMGPAPDAVAAADR